MDDEQPAVPRRGGWWRRLYSRIVVATIAVGTVVALFVGRFLGFL